MDDQQNNTFPIPAPTPPANPTGGTIPAIGDPPLAAVPAPVVSPTPMPVDQTSATPPPLQPDWQTQTVADAADLPLGPDNTSLNTPSQPGVGAVTPLETDARALPQSDVMPLPVSPAPTVAPNPFEATPPLSEPAPIASAPEPTPIPLDNTLDLSGQNVPLEPIAPTPAPVAPAPQLGALQPGVDISPDTGQNAQPDLIGGIPPDFGNSYNANAANSAAAKGGMKTITKVIIIAAVVIGLIIVISLALLLVNRNNRTPAVDLNQAQVDQTQNATDTNTSAPAAIPTGFKQVPRDCYSFGVLLPTTVNFTATSCKIAAKFGGVSQYDLSVTPVTSAVTDLQSLVDQAKIGTITSQEDITLNNIPAKKIAQTVNGVNVQTVVVIPTGKSYLFNGLAINGFIITTSASDDISKNASAVLISTWTWK